MHEYEVDEWHVVDRFSTAELNLAVSMCIFLWMVCHKNLRQARQTEIVLGQGLA